MEEFNSTGNRHRITLNQRQSCMVSGVKDVLSFDLHEVLLETEAGMLMLRGEDLHVNRLTLEKGEVDVDGRIDSLTYSDGGGSSSGKESFFSRMFR
ncbi:MAG: sporulation protein YabP [Acetatifactor sp.]